MRGELSCQARMNVRPQTLSEQSRDTCTAFCSRGSQGRGRAAGFAGSWIRGRARASRERRRIAVVPARVGSVAGSRSCPRESGASQGRGRARASRGFAGSRVRGFAGSRVRGFAGSRVRGFAGSRVRGFASFTGSRASRASRACSCGRRGSCACGARNLWRSRGTCVGVRAAWRVLGAPDSGSNLEMG